MDVTGPFHRGELDVQRRAGSLEMARAVGRSIASEVPAAAGRFLARQRLAVAASVGPHGEVWASLLTGPAGFIQTVEPRLMRLAARPLPGDPLTPNLTARPELGLLVLDPSTRQRMRFNGKGLLLSGEGLFLWLEQAYGNCSKYIQLRRPVADVVAGAVQPPAVASRLSGAQQARVARADTFFLASTHPEGGADASHRGGFPGFVRVRDDRTLEFDHYPGNGMFNTLGNLVASPSAGLLFIDFTDGDLLQLTGVARVAEDLTVTFEVREVRDTPAASPLRFEFAEYSPANPPLSRAGAAGISSNAGPTPRRSTR